ncbi:uncharacterized protein TM35_000271990 [Trypanosoma theileri]|uniref:Uncharacterized protein n=1 Tax=Trypanosoma theileri TaxID=67003 RepID=A0A1X0NR14_9TRYP|nr:uncharacterized protein TM35_000271990 [Trypanosoma theileri]ORC86609.1 hypothetical protein TM35_000271990 [Trypanosoma theileri]
MRKTLRRCNACGSPPAFSAGIPSFNSTPVRFCYVCGSSLRPSATKEKEKEKEEKEDVMLTLPMNTEWKNPTLVKKNPFSLQDVLKILWRQLQSWGPHTLIHCLPCSTVDKEHSSTDAHPLVGMNRYNVEKTTRAVHTEKPPVFYAWPLESCSTVEEEESKEMKFIKEDTPSSSLFVQLQIIYKILAEVILEYNTVLSSLQLRYTNEGNMWRTYVSTLKDELRQKNEEHVALLKRVLYLERELSLQNERHKRELLEERCKREEEHQWSLNMKQQQEDNLTEAYHFLRDTLVHGKRHIH